MNRLLSPLDAALPFLEGRSFADWKEEFDSVGYVIFKNVLDGDQLRAIRGALAPHLQTGKTGRNDFEGLSTRRVYALLAKSPVFADLVVHPLALAFAEAELGDTCLLSACLAINLLSGETAQPWHYDDGSISAPRPREAYGLSAFWAIDATTETNGATEIIPGSHLWPEQHLQTGSVRPSDFSNSNIRDIDEDPGARPDAIKIVMPEGSLALMKGTLWHRGGANKSSGSRLIITPQYCCGWARQIENMTLAVPPEIAAHLPERAQKLLGYSIHPPFMGYVNGVHPSRLFPSESALRA